MNLSDPLPAPDAILSRPDTRSAECIDLGIKLVISHGRDFAHQYLRDQGIGSTTILRVLGPEGHRRKPQYREV